LNGAQVTALLEVIGNVRSGALPKEVAKQIIAAAFPIPPERINSIIDPVSVTGVDESTAGASPAGPKNATDSAVDPED
jgi:hypothetical protein